jgi:3-deoxy-manno-octulosonate cytidylyltransferase (CMP-KDO synthetase)
MKDFVVVIPARLNSGRLGRKPLANICGKPMILHTYERALEATSKENIFIATDSNEIMEVCHQRGANCVMTSEKCLTGTDRIAEFSRIIKARIYVNLQGDEPIMDSANICKMIKAGVQEPDLIINGWAAIRTNKEYISRTIPKVVIKENGDLMYMSRSPVPGNKLNEFVEAKKQICVYSFPLKALQFLTENPQKSSVEEIEDIEILRFLEMDWRVKMIELSGGSIAVDTTKDLEAVRKKMGHYTKFSG